MTAQGRSTGASIIGLLALSSLAGLGTPAVAEAIVPVVQYVTSTSVLNSASPKMAIAQCPFGKSVLGGAALVSGAEGQVAIQGAFPTYDAGLGKHLFVVKATEDLTGTVGSWSVTAIAYCTSTTVVLFDHQSSAFDSTDIKSTTVECPAGMKVVGMGGEVSDDIYDSSPAALVGTIPTTAVVFRGFEANDDLTEVTARATEVGGALGGATASAWKVTAVAACAFAAYFDGLELRRNVEAGGGTLAFETDSRVEISCSSKDKQVIAAAGMSDDRDQGQWYLDRFSRYNAFQHYRIVSEAYRNPELGIALVKHGVQAICTDK
jgi:hypothetical protein